MHHDNIKLRMKHSITLKDSRYVKAEFLYLPFVPQELASFLDDSWSIIFSNKLLLGSTLRRNRSLIDRLKTI